MKQTKNTQPPGFKFIGSTGYIFVIQEDGGLIGEHRLIWEQTHGPIPDGFQIHHKNHIRTDNRLCNLDCVDTVTHKRLHVGHRWIDGVWVKTCTQCGWQGPDEAFPTKKVVDGVRYTRGNCVECERERIREKSRRRRELERKRAN